MAGKIRVAHCITMLELGGAQGNTLYTVSHLDPAHFEPILICGYGGMLDPETDRLPVKTHFCKHLVRPIHPLKDALAYRELVSLFKNLQPDIVHTHSSKAGILGRLAAAAAGVRVIIHTYHGFGFHRFQNAAVFRAYVLAERYACKRTHHLIFVSQDNWEWAKELGFTAFGTASLIRSGVNVRQISQTKRSGALQKEIGAAPGSKIAGMIACLKPQKDPVTFAKAARLVLAQERDVHFVLIGDGELRKSVLKEAANLPAGRFHFLGWRRDVFEILRNLDLLVLTSLWEGLPRVIPEAIVAGIPIVASDIDGNREILKDTKAGYLAQPRNAGDFATKILKAIQENLTVPAESSQRIRSEYDIDGMINSQVSLYREFMSRL